MSAEIRFLGKTETTKGRYGSAEYFGHTGLGNRPLAGEPPTDLQGEIQCQTRLGGLLNHYYRDAG